MLLLSQEVKFILGVGEKGANWEILNLKMK